MRVFFAARVLVNANRLVVCIHNCFKSIHCLFGSNPATNRPIDKNIRADARILHLFYQLFVGHSNGDDVWIAYYFACHTFIHKVCSAICRKSAASVVSSGSFGIAPIRLRHIDVAANIDSCGKFTDIVWLANARTPSTVHTARIHAHIHTC